VSDNPEHHKRHALKIIDALLAVALADANKSAAITQKQLNDLRRLFDRIEKQMQHEKKLRLNAWYERADEERKRYFCHTERDEARRMYCLAMRSPSENERQIAKRMGWSCFGDGGGA
jgi:Rad3-related DNA helicase